MHVTHTYAIRVDGAVEVREHEAIGDGNQRVHQTASNTIVVGIQHLDAWLDSKWLAFHNRRRWLCCDHHGPHVGQHQKTGNVLRHSRQAENAGLVRWVHPRHHFAFNVEVNVQHGRAGAGNRHGLPRDYAVLIGRFTESTNQICVLLATLQLPIAQ